MVRNGITVYLPRELEARVTSAAREEARSESSVIAEAVRHHFNRRNNQSPPGEASSAHMMARMDARFDKAIGEALILKEVVLLFIRVWLEHNPPIEEAHEDAAAASAEARFERFLGLVRDGLEGRSVANGEINPPPSPDHPSGEAPPV